MGLISRVSSRTYRSLSYSRVSELVTLTQKPKNETKMSQSFKALELADSDAKKILAAKMHLGEQNCNYQMEQYVYKKNQGGACIINVRKMWQKIVLAARIIAAVENPEDVCVVSTKEMGHRAILKFARFVGCS